jgi:hypothetical protein
LLPLSLFLSCAGRRLTWQTGLGTADLKASFGGGSRKHEIQCSTYQMAVLMLFNDADALSYEEIEAATSIPEDDLKRVLQSLACVKVRLPIFFPLAWCLQQQVFQGVLAGRYQQSHMHAWSACQPPAASRLLAGWPVSWLPVLPAAVLICHAAPFLPAWLLPVLLQGKAVLRKEPMSKDVKAGDAFSVNDAFTSKLYKVKIGMVTAQV